MERTGIEPVTSALAAGVSADLVRDLCEMHLFTAKATARGLSTKSIPTKSPLEARVDARRVYPPAAGGQRRFSSTAT
jgi:hypothetical protein